MTERYINLFTDFGFKKIFGEEANKDLLLDFLNQLFTERGKIIDITFLKNEKLGRGDMDRKAVFDLYCKNEKDERFIIELQKAKQNYFKDRSIYYSTFPIQEQAQRGEWDFKLQGVYTISIMDFIFDDKNENQLRHDVALIEKNTKEVFYDKLIFIYLEMPKFNKTIDELETQFEKWLFLLKNLHRLDRIPDKLKTKLFKKVFEIAEITKYNEQEKYAYQDSLKVYRDMKNVIDTAVNEAVEEAVEEAKNQRNIEMAKDLLERGMSIKDISELSKLSIAEVEKLKNN
ncbi:Rpn family recombination-promoting nuclease/putative transposase [Bernardetia sp. ABR2-2B]|uniref:Rpn family recombination-promoting nuclease/putative transposase n=1 Tax=Bernardetia sp. ABR2-2B TaxID=3127472 RepID=UPI0030CAD705